MLGLNDVTAVVLAAGRSRRWGAGNKLLHVVVGKPIARHVADIVRATFPHRIVVASDPHVASLFAGFETLFNEAPESGMGQSLQLGLTGVKTPFVIVCLADMPFVPAQHLLALCAAVETEDDIAASVDSVERPPGPPAIFPLRRLGMVSGDRGARDLLAEARLVPAPPGSLRDIDTPDDLNR